MKVQSFALGAAAAALSIATVSAETIAEINGNKFISPLKGKTVSGVRGLVTGKASTGIFLRSTSPDNDDTTSDSIFVFSKNFGNVKKGDIITLGGTVTEYRSDSAYMYLTEITSPTNIQVVSSGNTVTARVLGQNGLNPPTEDYTSLDNGNIFAVPNNQSQVSVANPTLNPSRYGMDFWESLSGEYVTVRNPTVLDVPNSFGDVWVVGDWPVTGQNNRGGLTITATDGNPEAILIQTPLDGSDNPLTLKLGDTLSQISGVVTYAFGSYTVRPDTKVNLVASRTPATPPPTSLSQTGGCKGITFTDYNVENLMPTGDNAGQLANQIVNFLGSPTIVFVQEIQDNSGDSNDGTTAADQTLQNLVNKISDAGGPAYQFSDIAPLDGTTGGEPGGNIRNAYLYNPKVVKLVPGKKGGARQATKISGTGENVALSFNPGLIAPNNAAFNGTRRPLIAHWSGLNGGNKFFTVNTHQTSKGGSSTLFGDLRPPVNEGVDQRDAEATVTGNFIKSILKANQNARIVASGDWNEFRFVKPQLDFVSISGLRDADDVVGNDPESRYGYLFDQNSQALIHVYVSPRIADRNLKTQRIHVNTWATFTARASDHDPDVVLANVCAK